MHTYSQSQGTWRDPSGATTGIGWAGREDGKNNPDYEWIADTGPLPRGLYTIGPAYHHPRLGPLTMDLTPDAGNTMFGRSAFRIHGAAFVHPELSSEGCIILNEVARIVISKSTDKQLQVIV